eukprot:208261_1
MLRFFDLKFEMMKSLSLSITTATASFDVLQTDQIKRDIENEIEDDDQLGDVDVEGEMDSDDSNDIVMIRKSKMNSNYSIGFHGHGLWKVRMLRLTYQTSDKTCKMEVPEVKADNEDEKENGDTDGMPQTRDASAGSQDKGQGESGDDQHSDSEELYVEHVTMK